MKLTIIPTSNLVMINDVNYFNIDMSWIPQMNGVDIHAVEWDEDHGWIHLVTSDPHVEITELGIFQKAVDLWEEKRQEHLEYEAEILALAQASIKLEQESKENSECLISKIEEYDKKIKELGIISSKYDKDLIALTEMQMQMQLQEELRVREHVRIKEKELRDQEQQLRNKIEFEPDDGDDSESDEYIDEDEDLFYDIEQLLKEI